MEFREASNPCWSGVVKQTDQSSGNSKTNPAAAFRKTKSAYLQYGSGATWAVQCRRSGSIKSTSGGSTKGRDGMRDRSTDKHVVNQCFVSYLGRNLV